MKTIDEIRKDNLSALAKELGGIGVLADKIERSPSQVSQWVSGSKHSVSGKPRRLSSDSARYIEQRCAKQNGWLDVDHKLTNEDASLKSKILAIHPDDTLPDDMVFVPESRISFSAGNGRTATFELIEEEEPASYRLSWFQKYRINPDRVKRFRVSGDSMEPMLFDRDTILVNMDETNIIDNKMYAIRYGDELRVKYLRKKLDGSILLRSINPLYKEEEVSPALASEHITIIGRVRDASGTGGL
jgi:phage repressor protein C with HTH and peptisase S24 domain